MFILRHLCRRRNQFARMVSLVFFLRSCTRLSSSSLSLALHRRRHPPLHRRRHPHLHRLCMVAYQVQALCNLLPTHRQQMLMACTQSRHPPLPRQCLPRLLSLCAVTQQLHVHRDMPLQMHLMARPQSRHPPLLRRRLPRLLKHSHPPLHMHLMARTQSRHPPLVRRRLHRLEPTSANSLKKRSPHQSERRRNGATAAGTRCQGWRSL